jgi:hypothetical protein
MEGDGSGIQMNTTEIKLAYDVMEEVKKVTGYGFTELANGIVIESTLKLLLIAVWVIGTGALVMLMVKRGKRDMEKDKELKIDDVICWIVVVVTIETVIYLIIGVVTFDALVGLLAPEYTAIEKIMRCTQ